MNHELIETMGNFVEMNERTSTPVYAFNRVHIVCWIFSFFPIFVFVFDFDLGVRFDQYMLSNTTTTIQQIITIKIHKDRTKWQEMDGTSKTHASYYYYYYYYSRSQCLLMHGKWMPTIERMTNSKYIHILGNRELGKIEGKKVSIKHWKNTISETKLKYALCTPCRLYHYGYFYAIAVCCYHFNKRCVPYE